MEDGTRTIIFLGAPRAKDIVKTWKAPDGPEISLSKTADVASLPPFEIDPTHASRNVAWRRLPDPLHSLSQEFAETNFGPPTVEPSFIDRSLQGYYNNDDDEMDLHDLPSSGNDGRETSQIPSPFLAGYDFDINEITELEDLPSARTISGDSSRRFSLVVAVMETQSCELVATKFGTSINLTKLIVGDLTRQQFEIACWDNMATVAQKIHVHDIVYFRDLALLEFKGVVSAGTRRRSQTTILYRCDRLGKEDDVLRPRLDLEDQQTRLVRKLRNWIVGKAWIPRDVPPTLDTQY